MIMDKITIKAVPIEKSSPFWESFVLPILKYKRMTYFVVSITVLSTLTICLLLKNQYTSSASILPTGASGISSELKDLAAGSLGELGLGSSNEAPENSSALFPNVLNSRLISEKILKRTYSFNYKSKPISLTLEDYIGQSNLDRTIRKLSKLVDISTDKKTGVISLSVTTEYPEFSAAIVHAYLEELDDYNIHHRQSTASENEKFTARRLEEIKLELAAAEDTLRSFKQANLNYLVSSDPLLQLELSRLQRELDLKASLYLTLAQQNEMAKVDAVKDIPVVQVLDRGSIPLEKSSPHRSYYLAFALLGSLFFSILLSLWFDLSLKRGANHDLRRIATIPGIRMNKIESRIAQRLVRIADIMDKEQAT
ncbi:MAG TPA: hypothetical protein DEO84_06725 [candidate division Zixibacteria bacterium]|nr:hypothetical protein [candidate division Zixibacteria bacterium]HBZ00997.1 hypothetical protein [candidate division Zixibacteria bacterium]